MTYAALMQLAAPVLRRHLTRRAARGKELPDRLGERYGIASKPRPRGRVVWFHAASVGESVALLSLIKGILFRYDNVTALVTTGTLTSARILENRLPKGAIHQFMPLDRPGWIEPFLDHWKPDLAIWTESEIWPNFLTALKARKIPAAMVNGRMSLRSARRWRFLKPFFKRLLSSFAVRLAQSEADAMRLSAFGASFGYVGNLKLAVEPLPVDDAAVMNLWKAIAGRPFWLAAMTHAGEEAIAMEVHRIISEKRPNLLTIIVPRHPDRGGEIERLAEQAGLCADRRAHGALPDQQTAIYIADTLGELGIFYALSPIAFIGGSFTVGIHSPIEAVQQRAAIVYGPDIRNNGELATSLEQAHGAVRVADARQLAATVEEWLAEPERARSVARAATAVLQADAEVVGRVMAALEPLFAGAGIK
jgi:3-deoxy-D-manno-octulosonic-acid transferase